MGLGIKYNTYCIYCLAELGILKKTSNMKHKKGYDYRVGKHNMQVKLIGLCT